MTQMSNLIFDLIATPLYSIHKRFSFLIEEFILQTEVLIFMTPITFVLIVKNAEATIYDTLAALQDWPEVVVLDTGSQDSTLEIVKKFQNVSLHKSPFYGFGPTRNIASSFSKTSWVFHLDADEIPSAKLLEELKSLSLQQDTVYFVNRDNYFWNRHMKGCSGWYPDYVGRLYHKDLTRYSGDLVHEKVLTEGLKKIRLKNTLKHTPYQNLKTMQDKLNHYSDLFVKNTNKKSSRLSPYIHGSFAFFKSYILKRGFTQGFRGLILSKYIADVAFYKYLKLYEARQLSLTKMG